MNWDISARFKLRAMAVLVGVVFPCFLASACILVRMWCERRY